MFAAPLWWLALFLVFALLCLAWIAWRFFLFPQQRADFAQMRTPLVAACKFALRWLIAPVALTGAVVGVALQLGSHHVLGEVAPQALEGTEQIRTALKGELLVPPPPLPPASFMSEEHPSLASADRDWSKLEPRFARQVLAVMAGMERRGYAVALIEGYRTAQRQEALADARPEVTQARAFQSRHQFGLAADLAPLRAGRIVLSEQDPWAWQAYQALGEEAEAQGLVWGGRWTLRDYGHVEAKSQVVAAMSR